MGNLLWPVKTRVRMAFLSAVVVAIISALLSFTPAGRQGMSLVSHTLAQAAASTAATATPPSGGPGSVADGAPAPTATPQPTATTPPPPPAATPTTPRPTQPAGSGQFTDLHGTISNIDYTAQTFLCTPVGGSAVLVRVTSTTQYQGSSTTFGGLQNGWSIEASGYQQANGSFLAYVIQSDSGGGA